MLILQQTIQQYYPYLIKLGLLLCLLVWLNQLSSFRLSLLGIYPRKLWSILGIVCSPFLHANFGHLFSNLIPLWVLSLLLLTFGPEFYVKLSSCLILMTGSFIWLFGRPGLHIGASGLVTAYWGFLVSQALLGQFELYHLLIGFICIYYFIGIFFGIFPRQDIVSWEGHLFGLISGILAYLFPAIINFSDFVLHQFHV